MNKIWEKYKELFIVTAYVLAVFVMIKVIAQPLLDKIEEKRIYAEEKKTDQEVIRKKIEELPAMKEKMETVNSEADRLNVFFRQDNALSLIEKLESLAAETGNDIKITIVSEDNSENKNKSQKSANKDKEGVLGDLESFNFLSVSLGLEGDFNSILKFMEKMENMEYFSDIVSLDIENVSEDDLRGISSGGSVFQVTGNRSDNSPTREISRKYENPLGATLEVIFYIENENIK